MSTGDRATVVVTRPEYDKASGVFAAAAGFDCIPAPADEAGLAQKIRDTGARFAIIGVERYTHELYQAVPRGGVIARFGVGHDGVDKALAGARGILCCNTPGMLDDSVAECAIALMLTVARRISVCTAGVKAGSWPRSMGIELAGKTLAVIGCGSIGRRVARIARLGFGMQVIGFGRTAPPMSEAFDLFTGDFEAAVRAADVVSIHLPDRPENRNFINSDRLRMMKAPAILINTARGGVLDEDALYDAVTSGGISGAGLDVFKREPYVPHDPGRDLRTLDAIAMTPHIGSASNEACDRMARSALQNLRHAMQGRFREMTVVH